MLNINQEFKTLDEMLSHFNIKPKKIFFYRQALTHTSFLKAKKEESNRNNDYQDLEFLGDSILQFLASNYLFRKYSNLNAGSLTLLRSKMVCTKTLNEISEKINLKKFLVTGPGQMHEEVVRSQKVGADIFESFVAALYLDLGLKTVLQFLEKTLFLYDELFLKNKELKDAKTRFQEYMQTFSKNFVTYKTVIFASNQFKSEAIHDNIVYGTGYGKNKNAAEEDAAEDALNKLQK